MAANVGRNALIDAVYAIWEEWDRLDEYPTELDAALLIERLRNHVKMREYVRWHGSEKAHQDVIEWLTDRATWSPVVDMVAVDRAVNTLDHATYLSLTLREKNAFFERLARMQDPFDWPGQGVPEYSERGFNLRFMWPTEDYKHVTQRVTKARMKAADR